MLLVQTTHLPQKNGGSVWFDLANTNEVDGFGRNQPITMALQCGYLFEATRMVLPGDAPTNNFDFMATLPHCPRKAFQDEIERNTGLRAHAEQLNTNVLLLRVRDRGAPGLKPAVGDRGFRLTWGDGIYRATNSPISDLRAFLETSLLKRPVIDDTKLTNLYNIDIKWEFHQEKALDQVLLDQLGLVLVQTNMPIEMLVVEKVK